MIFFLNVWPCRFQREFLVEFEKKKYTDFLSKTILILFHCMQAVGRPWRVVDFSLSIAFANQHRMLLLKKVFSWMSHQIYLTDYIHCIWILVYEHDSRKVFMTFLKMAVCRHCFSVQLIDMSMNKWV